MSSDEEIVTGGAAPKTGFPIVRNSPAKVYLVEYQTVTSHGHEAVSGAVRKTTVSYYPGAAFLTPYEWNDSDPHTKIGRVHVPIHNPPNINERWYLENISVNATSENGASVDYVTLYYDSEKVVTQKGHTTGVFHIEFNADEAKKYAYVPPKGISIQLILKFPKAESFIKLSSVTLLYKAT